MKKMRIAVLGAGHMGAWLIRELSPHHKVAVYDTEKQKMDSLNDVHPLTNLSDLRDFQPQILINAVSLKNTTRVFREAAPFVPGDCLLADIASLKGDIPDFYREQKFPFVSLHPMFGPRFADLHRLSEENAIIISESHESGKRFFREFFNAFNLRVFEYSFAQHDELMAEALTLPFTASIVFAACKPLATVPGTTYSRHREIARKLLQEDDYLLSEVLFNPDSMKQLERITESLEFLKHVIRAKDYEEAERYFNRLRRNFLADKPDTPD